MNGPLRCFVDLYYALASTSSTASKVQYMAEYFRTADPQELGWAVAILRGEKLKRTVSGSLLRQWVSELCGLPLWLVEESYHVVGDLAETCAILTTRAYAHDDKPHDRLPLAQSLLTWMQLCQHMQGAPLERKRELITSMWNRLSENERLVFNKLLTGGLRVGVSKGLVIKALAAVTQREEGFIANWLLRLSSPEEFSLDMPASENSLAPYPFLLAHSFKEESINEFSIDEWVVEWKWDGIRAQLVIRGDELVVWSRGEEIVTEAFPELASLCRVLPSGTVLDGEIVAWNVNGPGEFTRLQRRLRRKRVTPALVEKIPIKFIAYDLLEQDRVDIRSVALVERREKLARIISQLQPTSEAYSIMMSEAVVAQSWEELTRLRSQAHAFSAEGLMLKQKDSSYGIGRQRGFWYKWKNDPLTVDAVLVYAQKGHGRRANVYSDYTFALWDGDTLVPFAKAYSGLTDKEIQEVDRFIKHHSKESFGPVKSVEPQLVFEVAFEGISTSARHKSGLAVRFPRILRWRRDKKPSEADSLEAVRRLLQQRQSR